MSNNDKWIWLPILALLIGIGLPPALVEFQENSWQERIWIGMFTSMAVLTAGLVRAIGKKFPELSYWARYSISGTTLLAFSTALFASGAGVLFALAPVPHWLHLVFGFIIAVGALMIFVTL